MLAPLLTELGQNSRFSNVQTTRGPLRKKIVQLWLKRIQDRICIIGLCFEILQILILFTSIFCKSYYEICPRFDLKLGQAQNFFHYEVLQETCDGKKAFHSLSLKFEPAQNALPIMKVCNKINKNIRALNNCLRDKRKVAIAGHHWRGRFWYFTLRMLVFQWVVIALTFTFMLRSSNR